MKLKSIEVHNFRSIDKTQRLELESGLTVILGPNNEGKSNLLRAIVLAMECLKVIRNQSQIIRQGEDNGRYRILRNIYDWESDFPLKLQEKYPSGETKLILEFELSEDDKIRFKKECGITINAELTLEILVGARNIGIKVRNKRGRGATSFKSKTSNIAKFVSKSFDFQYIPAIRPSQLSLEVVGNLIERELASLEEDEEYRNALDIIDQLQKPIYERLGAEVQKSLRQLLPSVKAIQLGQGPARGYGHYGSRTRLPQFIVDDGTATDLEAKGDGIKSLVAISLMRASKAGGSTGDLVVAIEEPESHLHPGAVRGLSQVLQEMAVEHQVIITTHSPLLATRAKLQSNIIVSKAKAVPATSINDVRKALGVQVEDNLRSAEYVLVVEGKHDITILQKLFCHRGSQFAEIIEKGRLVFDDLSGSGNIAYKLSTLRMQIAQPILLVDDDPQGRDCIKKAKSDGNLEERFIFQWKRPRGLYTELEDVIAPSIYWRNLESKCGVKLDEIRFSTLTGDWSTRMKELFELSGKTWTKSAESNAKCAVADSVVVESDNAVSEEFEKQFDNIIEAICAIVCEEDV
jgi:predicted ATP-dependent endonuclease of OLD family